MEILKTSPIKIIIGLGNPGKQFQHTRHNVGFLVLDALGEKYDAHWEQKKDMEIAEIVINDQKIILVKPQTFMNNSGKIMPSLLKQGVKIDNILVVHDELEKKFGVIDFKTEGSHRGHNGLRSIIDICGANFMRLCFGIGRPDKKEEVGEYVLSNFEQREELSKLIDKAVSMIDSLLKK